MKLVPLEDRVVVKLMDKEQTTKSGIVIPETAQEKQQKGKVMAVGAGKYSEKGELLPMPVKVGDVVVFAKYSGVEMKIDGEDYTVLRGMTDLIGVLPEG